MTPKQIELVENSWDYVLLNVEEAGDIFYQKLFEMRPDVKPLFKGDIKAQSRKLTAMITFLVHKLSNFDEVKNDVIALGKRHNNYEVKPDDYSAVGASLLWTLEKGLGKNWNDELKTAWAELYSILSGLMISAQNPSVAA